MPEKGTYLCSIAFSVEVYGVSTAAGIEVATSREEAIKLFTEEMKQTTRRLTSRNIEILAESATEFTKEKFFNLASSARSLGETGN